MSRTIATMTAGVVAGCMVFSAIGAEGPWTVVGADRMDVAVVRGEAPAFVLDNNMVGQGWRGGRLDQLAAVRDGKRVYGQDKVGFFREWWEKNPMPGRIDLRYELSRSGDREFRIRYELTPDADLSVGFPKNIGEPSATIGPVLRTVPYFKGGTVVFTLADGKVEERPYPVSQSGFDRAKAVEVRTASGETTRLEFDPPLFVHCDNGELRCMTGSQKGELRKAGEVYAQTITLRLPEAAAFEPANRYVDIAGWFPYENANDFAPGSPIGMDDWLDKPAGKRGWLKVDGARLVFEDGTPAKFWGGNTCHSAVMSEPEAARQWARRYAKYGNNLMRWHKWTHSGTHGQGGVLTAEDHTKLDPECMKKFDNFHAELKSNGVHLLWSHIYRYNLSPADKDRIEHYDEVAAAIGKGGNTVGLVNFVPGIQDLYIAVTTNLLNHVNAVTGLRYADDPALAFIELRNEDCIFFWGYDRLIRECPTYAKRLNQRFAEWAAKEYGSFEAAVAAWGGIEKSESLADGVSPWSGYYYQGLPLSKRVADSYRFLFDVQDEFYKRYEKAIRDTGYKGVLIGSCWQAHSFIGHLWNVYSDSRIGPIDRHNYAASPMNQPGVGLMSCFLQAATDRPFGFSEWAGGAQYGCSVDMPTVAIYGMGLQGWDYSNNFAENEPPIPNYVGGLGTVGNRLAASAQYPTLTRMIYRGDVKEGDVVAQRTVGLDALRAGDPGFVEEFNLLGGANNKEFKSVAPSAALAAGRVGLTFADGKVARPVEVKLGSLIDAANEVVTSSTGQLRWHYGGRGFFTANTPGTKAVVGYAGGRAHELGGVSIRFENPFAIVYVTALDKDAAVASGKRLLITAMARMVDKGTVFDTFSGQPIDNPNANVGPLVIEPVKAEVVLARPGAIRVTPLDHEGRLRESTDAVPVERIGGSHRLTLDGAKHKAIYYLVQEEP